MDDPTLTLDGVTLRRSGRTVLDGVTLSFSTGLTVLLGRNGAGKTTMLQALAEARPPSSGRIVVEGIPLARDRQVRRRVLSRIGFLAQSTDLPLAFTARECIEYCGWLKGVAPRDLRRRGEAALEAVHLRGSAETKVGALSGGMQQRVAIAASLAHDPALWILDEPTVGLDPEQRSFFRAVVAERARSSTVVMSTHLAAEVAEPATRVAVLGGGRVIFDGTADQLAGEGGPGPFASGVERGYEAVARRELGEAL